jgi:kynurenine formamidase
MNNEIPKYYDLPTIGPNNDHHAWEVFGPKDNLGTLNFINPESIVSAAQSIKDGKVICLSLPLDAPYPSLGGGRDLYQHHVNVSRSGRDDYLDKFYLQASSQWDSLRHIRYREFGYYGGYGEEDLDQSDVLGIDFMAKKGVIGRGVLVDVASYFEHINKPIDPQKRFGIKPADLELVLEWQGVSIEPGDILIIRTGWLKWYLSLDEVEKKELAGSLHNGDGGLECPGLETGKETAAWLWDHQISAVASDNPALEALKVIRDLGGFLHRLLIPLMGMPIGEFWYLEELSSVCKSSSQYSFFLTSAPLNIPKGVGSPNNAYAIF